MTSQVRPTVAAGLRTKRQTAAPCVVSPTADLYYPSLGHEEAIARLMYLVDENQRCGVVTGPRGAGKTTILTRASQLLKRAGWRVRRIELAGLDHSALMHRLAVELGCNPSTHSDIHELWDQIELTIAAAARVQHPWVLIGDHADRLRPGALSLIENLLHSPHVGGLVFLLAHRDDEDSLLLRTCREQCGLKIEVPLLSVEETQGYIDQMLDQEMLSSSEFTRDAIRLVARISEGNPLQINRIYRAAILASNGEGHAEIESDLVLSVAEELLGMTTVGYTQHNRA